MNIWLTVAIPAFITLIGLFISYRIQARALAAARPKVDAETLKLGIESQNAAMESLGRQITAAITRADQAEKKAGELETRLIHLDASLDESHEQNELMAKQLDAAQNTALELTRQNGIIRSQNGILWEHFRLVQDWANRMHDLHPDGIEAPPQLLPFVPEDGFGN
jgi:septal ring factor EnvC (AmiA/AmiB activator)